MLEACNNEGVNPNSSNLHHHHHHHFLEIGLIHVNYSSRQHWWLTVVHCKIVGNNSAIQSLWHSNKWVKLVSLLISYSTNLLCLLVEHSCILTTSPMTQLGQFHEGFCNAKLHTIVSTKGLNINVHPTLYYLAKWL